MFAPWMAALVLWLAPLTFGGPTWQPWTVTVTAYCPCKRCCGRFADGRTASGRRATGRLIAAPKPLKFGTRIDVPGYGVAPVADRGGAIRGRRLDVLFPTHRQARQWGRRRLTVYVFRGRIR
jgi:3D (Asp-Asp-Asp) domain-containing protein